MDNTPQEEPKKPHWNTQWTREVVLAELESILADIMANKSIIYLGEVYETRHYSRKKFSEWEHTFESDSQISETISTIKAILESRINVGGLRNDLNPAMTKFNLVNNYNWKDKSETAQDVTSNGQTLGVIMLPTKINGLETDADTDESITA